MHNYIEDKYELKTYMCSICGIIKSGWVNPTTNKWESGYFYQRPAPIYGWVNVFTELTCDEMIIKKILE